MKAIIKIISSLLIILTLGNCSKINSSQNIDAIVIDNQNKLTTQLSNTILFYEKNVDNKSALNMISLDMRINEKYILPQEGNFPRLFPNRQSVSYIKSYKSAGKYYHGVWMYVFLEDKIKKIGELTVPLDEIYLFCQSISPNGEKIITSAAIYSDEVIGLATLDINEGNTIFLKTDLPMNQCPVYSPDLKNIVVTCAVNNPGTNNPGFQLCLLSEKGRFIRTLTQSGDRHHSYFFSPNGEYLVYSEFDIKLLNTKPTHRFYLLNIETENSILLLDWDIKAKSFSDDSQQIIFEGRPTPKSPWGIYIINIDGTNLRHLTYFDEFLEEWYSDIEEY